MKTIEEIEQLLVEACDKAIEEGWKIKDGGFRNPAIKTCCPIAALVGQHPCASFTDAACEMLDLNECQVEAFWVGFDDAITNPLNDPLYALGQKLRAKYITKEQK